jgi:hypothetical protein
MKKREKKLQCFDDFLHFMNELHWTFFFLTEQISKFKKNFVSKKLVGGVLLTKGRHG